MYNYLLVIISLVLLNKYTKAWNFLKPTKVTAITGWSLILRMRWKLFATKCNSLCLLYTTCILINLIVLYSLCSMLCIIVTHWYLCGFAVSPWQKDASQQRLDCNTFYASVSLLKDFVHAFTHNDLTFQKTV